jgi:ATP/maltotriose-dependent transcriptional regulator MalT
LQLAQRGGIIEILSNSYLGLARVSAVNGNYSEALDLIDTAYRILSALTWHMYIVQVLTAKARVLIQSGRYEVARFWLNECERITRGASARAQQDTYILESIRLLIAQGQFAIAAKYADEQLERFRYVGLVTLEIEALVLSACANYKLENMQKAMSQLERALILARPSQFKRRFIDEGRPVIELLYLLEAHDVEVDYAELLLSACDYPAREPDVNLSEREMDVLNLLEKGFSNRYIADKLFIAPSTVKVHTRRLYSKLSVTSREQAVARAKALQLL